MLEPSHEDHEGEEELQIIEHFSTPPYQDDPTNHVVPCLDSFPMPGVEGGAFFVMPLLSEYKEPPFYDLSEIHDFLTQIFEASPYCSNLVFYPQHRPRGSHFCTNTMWHIGIHIFHAQPLNQLNDYNLVTLHLPTL
jgi:hypothetical protein